MNNCPAIYCENYDAVCAGGYGAFCFSEDGKHMFIKLPTIRDKDVPSRLRIGGEEHPRWILSGPREKPTLTPSINAVGEWHGYMINGELISS